MGKEINNCVLMDAGSRPVKHADGGSLHAGRRVAECCRQDGPFPHGSVMQTRPLTPLLDSSGAASRRGIAGSG